MYLENYYFGLCLYMSAQLIAGNLERHGKQESPCLSKMIWSGYIIAHKLTFIFKE